MTHVLCLLTALSLAIPLALQCRWRRLLALAAISAFDALVWWSMLWTPPRVDALTAADYSALAFLLVLVLCLAGIVPRICDHVRLSGLGRRLKSVENKIGKAYLSLLDLESQELGFEVLALQRDRFSILDTLQFPRAISSRGNYSLAWQHLDNAIELLCQTRCKVSEKQSPASFFAGSPEGTDSLERDIAHLERLCDCTTDRTAVCLEELGKLRGDTGAVALLTSL